MSTAGAGDHHNGTIMEAPMTSREQANTLAKSVSAGATQLLLPEWCATLTTREGVRLLVRPAAPEDEQRLAEFFTHVTADDVRFRFLTGADKIGHELLRRLVELDHTRKENFLAFAADGETLVATAMLAADDDMKRAEVAIATRAEFKHKGVGWTLLTYLADYARSRGIRVIESIEARGNREAIAVERDCGFTAASVPSDPTLTILTKTL